MKIGFLINDLNAGGAERAAVSLANYFAQHGTDTEIITFKECESFYPLSDKVEHCTVKFDEIPVKMSVKRLTGAVRRMFTLRSFIKSRELDILIGMSFSMTWYTVFSTVFTKTKSIGTERNNPYKYKSSKFNTILRKIFYRLCNGYIFQTKKAAEFFTDKLKPTDAVIPNAIFNDAVYELEAPEKREKIISAVGRLTDQKRFDILIDAFSLVADKLPDYKLIIFGEGELRNELENKIKTLSLEDRVFLPGKNPEVVRFINRTSMFVLSSDIEGMPNALMEAIAMGLPSISTRCDMGPEEIIENRVNGILTQVGNSEEIAQAMLEIANNPDFARKLSENGRKLLKTHSIEEISRQWLDFLKRV